MTRLCSDPQFSYQKVKRGSLSQPAWYVIVLLDWENDITLGRNRTVTGARHLAGVYWFLLSLSGEMGRGRDKKGGKEEKKFPLKISCWTPLPSCCAQLSEWWWDFGPQRRRSLWTGVIPYKVSSEVSFTCRASCSFSYVQVTNWIISAFYISYQNSSSHLIYISAFSFAFAILEGKGRVMWG